MDWRKLFGCQAGHELDYFPPEKSDKSLTVQPPLEVLEAGTTEWRNSLVCQFLGAAPNFISLQRTIDKLWNQTSTGARAELYSREGLSYIASALGIPLTMDSITASKTRLEYAKVCIEIEANEDILETVEVILANGKTSTIFVEVPWFPYRCRKCKSLKVALPDSSSSKEIVNSADNNSITEPEPFLKEQPVHAESSNQHHKILNEENLGVELVNDVTHESAPISNDTPSNSNPKRGRGRPLKIKAKSALRGSANRFEILSTVEENSSLNELPVKKTRPAAAGVAKLIKEIKSKKKEQTQQVKRTSEGNSEETRVKPENSAKIFNTTLGSWNVLTNYDSAINGRIWFMWKKGIDISLCHSTDQSITANCIFNNTQFIITAIYRSNSGSSRRFLWQHLKNLNTRFGSLPWILGGDFNTYLHHKESSDSLLLGPYSSSEMTDFQELVQDLSLYDHPFFGPIYTWSNKQKDSYLARKLDRVLINTHWVVSFQNSFVKFTASGRSDHCMALAWINKETQTNRPKPFKFFNFWSKHPNFLEHVLHSWQQPSQGNPMMKLFLKLKRLKPCLQKLNKDNYSDISVRVRLKKKELEQIQISTLNGNNSLVKELDVQKELNDLEDTEYMFLKQKAKVQWIKEGDKCTKLFHSALASKNKRDTIRILINNEGKRLKTYDDMANEIIDFFHHQLGETDPKVQPPDPFTMRNLLQIHLPTEVTTDPIKNVTTDEIKEALFNQGNDKAPGPDGFTPLFFKHSWSVIGDDFVDAVKYFFQESHIHPAFNSTIIVLIPKTQNPSTVRDFRPISCCFVVYKTITKILVKRMNQLLPNLISLGGEKQKIIQQRYKNNRATSQGYKRACLKQNQ
ncbi:uncharacterized protein LOC120126869 [Hibiscus syriacus]|uniref:uncharacterized protein LOC120126869 n=1 Tax=Hibiscus syriacus TaxID=106335 RepID=UPI001920F7BF|nr:uncharacterized protein LOC120126869 [Hibiscus syriacus]